MITIIAGSRTITNYSILLRAIELCGFEITEIVSGGARGVDQLGERYAKENNIPLTVMKADWQQHSKAAGTIRNRKMAEYAEALIAIWDGRSKGTCNMIREADRKNLTTLVYEAQDHKNS